MPRVLALSAPAAIYPTPVIPEPNDTGQGQESGQGPRLEGVKMSEAQLRSFGIELIEPEPKAVAPERPISGFVEACNSGRLRWWACR